MALNDGLAWYRAGARAASVLPGNVTRALAVGVGGTIGRMPDYDGRRAIAASHMARVLGRAVGHQEGRRMAAEVFANYARYWAESLRLPSLTREEIAAGVTTIGEEHVGAARAEGRGLVIASPHLGGWEWGAMYLIGKGVPVTAAVERLEPAAVFEWLVAFRERLGMHVVPVGPEASAGVLRALHNNEVACLLSDRLVGQASGVEVTFFGERVKLPAGPVALALRARAPILAAGIYYGRAANAHTIIFRPPLQLDRGRRFRDAVRDGAQALAAELEEVIRPAPTQWHILQPNWPGDPPLHTARSWAATLPWGGHRPALGAGAAGAPAAVP